MFRLIRFLFFVLVLVAIWWFATTFPLGKYTLWGHIQRIWKSQETKDLVEGTEEAAKPVYDKAKKAVKAGVDEAKRSP